MREPASSFFYHYQNGMGLVPLSTTPKGSLISVMDETSLGKLEPILYLSRRSQPVSVKGTLSDVVGLRWEFLKGPALAHCCFFLFTRVSFLMLFMRTFRPYTFILMTLSCISHFVLTVLTMRLLPFFAMERCMAGIHPPPGGGVLPYVALTGTCGPIGYGFQGVLS